MMKKNHKCSFPTEQEVRAMFATREVTRDAQTPFGKHLGSFKYGNSMEFFRKPTLEEKAYLEDILLVNYNGLPYGETVQFRISPSLKTDAAIRKEKDGYFIYVNEEEITDILSGQVTLEKTAKFEFFTIPHEVDHIPTEANGAIIYEIDAVRRTMMMLSVIEKEEVFIDVCLENQHLLALFSLLGLERGGVVTRKSIELSEEC